MKDDTSISSYRKMFEEIEHDIAYLTKCQKKCNLKSAKEAGKYYYYGDLILDLKIRANEIMDIIGGNDNANT